MPKSLSERTDEALDIINEAREALDGASLQQDALRPVVQKLTKSMERLRKAYEDLGDAMDDVDEALAALDAEQEEQEDLKLGKHVDALETAAATLDELSNVDFEEE